MAEKSAWIEIERLKAQMEALLKAREAMSEQISNLSERIGELRSSLVEHERESSKLEAEIKKTIELVQKVKPEEILKEITKFDAKIEALKARISSYDALIDRVVEEMKEMRRTFVQFRSLDAIAKMSEDLKKDLEKGRKIEAEMSKHASKVESMFAEIQKRYKEFYEVLKSMEELRERFRLLLREFDKLRIEFASTAKKEDFENLEKKLTLA
jgi:chromosome segregation ATPase